MRWFLVGQHYTKHHFLGYRGVCGDWWNALQADGQSPNVELYDQLIKNREYVVSPRGYHEFVCTNEAIARECYEHIAEKMNRAIWLEASFSPLLNTMGIDFGGEN